MSACVDNGQARDVGKKYRIDFNKETSYKTETTQKSTTAIKYKHVFCDIGIHLSNTTSRALTMATTQTFSIISLLEIWLS